VILGRVVGTVWATRKDHRLSHNKLLLVRPYFYYNPSHEAEQIVAVDRVDAGVGDDVVVCLGAPARGSLGGVNYPVDAAVLGVVDRCQLSREAFGERRHGETVAARPLSFIGAKEPRRLEWIG
jgi:ethanolamine utilization protein EutN